MIVASFGVLNTGLLYAVGTRLTGVWAVSCGGAAVAGSPIDVDAFHQVRADVVVQTLGILGDSAFRQLGPDLRGDRRMGVLIGLATAVKFTGLCSFPRTSTPDSWPGPAGSGLREIAGALTIAITLACTPYAIIHFNRYFSPPSTTVLGGPSTYYQDASHFGEHVAFFPYEPAPQLGPAATPALPVGPGLCLRESWRAWFPASRPSRHDPRRHVRAAMIFPAHEARDGRCLSRWRRRRPTGVRVESPRRGPASLRPPSPPSVRLI